MNEAEKLIYSNTLKNMLNSLKDTWIQNQDILKFKIEDLEADIRNVIPQVRGLKTKLKKEREELDMTIKVARRIKDELHDFISDCDSDDLDKIKRISEIMNGHYEDY